MLWTDRPVPEVVRLRMSRTLLGKPVYATACYLVGDTLIDTGCSNQGGHLLSALSDPLRTGRLRQVVITHHHEDHTGNARAIARAMGRAPRASRFCAAVMAQRHGLPLYRRLVWGRPSDQEADDIADEVETSVGALRVLATPGHTPGDVAFYHPERKWLFSGDLVLGVSQTVVRPKEDVAAMTRSTEAVAALEVAHLFGSHRLVLDAGARHLEERAAFLHDARRRVREAVAADPSVVERPAALARRLFGPEPWIYYFSSGDFSRTHFVRSILRSEGLVAGEDPEDGPSFRGALPTPAAG